MTTWLLVLVLAGEPIHAVRMESERACRAALEAAPPQPINHQTTLACVQKTTREDFKGRRV